MTDTFQNLAASRRTALQEASKGLWSDAPELMARVLEESGNQKSWRPVRAGVLAMIAEEDRDRVWMTAEEFKGWRRLAKELWKLNGKAQGLPKPEEALGISAERATTMSNAERLASRGQRIPKAIALACAHYLMGLDQPCDHQQLHGWFWPRFGQMASIAAFLDYNPEPFSRRVNGYYIHEGVRVDFEAEAFFIRALDWVWRMGPTCPYGERAPIAYWPEQTLFPR